MISIYAIGYSQRKGSRLAKKAPEKQFPVVSSSFIEDSNDYN
jgi:hypothetical protein